MRVFLLDLWLDLREKRLAPLALVLVGAIVAVPIVLAKDQKAPEAPAQTTPTATTASAAPVISSEPSTGPASSKLQTFNSRDPFEPTSAAAATGATTTTGSTGVTPGSSSTGGGTTGTGTSEPQGTGGGATTGSQPSTGNGTTGTGTNGTGNTTGETKTTVFTYTVDVRFGEAGDMKAYKGVNRLDLIPSSENPKAVFLGVTTTGKTAVFLIDSNIGVDSNGKCRPSNDECTFLYLRPDGDHDQATLTDSDGTVYHLRVLRIHRVTVSSSNGSTGNSGNSGTSNGSGGSRQPAFTGQANRKDTSSSDSSVPGENAPPGEPDQRSSFQQFFADSATDSGP